MFPNPLFPANWWPREEFLALGKIREVEFGCFLDELLQYNRPAASNYLLHQQSRYAR